ncbi:C-type lectin domain-containing protein [Polyangium sorediatum]|uniref:C-type lectin domain-containing protein n=1 Tax=Polyangium sorediatum TaxID=889274 RepID=A0ABT6NJ15_9BACT|nr:C-type lectin domain-containing protein [Polyangium sorediatum]MDI1428287.1 C-type lectin domain-containing protein [Polyangium sorediatum]
MRMSASPWSLVLLALAGCGPGPAVVSDPDEALKPRPFVSAAVSASASPSASASAPDKPKLEVAGGALPLPPFSCGKGKEITAATGTYCVFTELRSWQDAERHCEEHGGHLASITSEAEAQAIRAAIVSPVTGENLWIGLVEPTEGRWLGPDAKPARFFVWNDGEPNNDGGAENCGSWLLGSGRWNDVDCFVPRMALCESRSPARTRGALKCGEDKRIVVGKREYCLQDAATWQNAQARCVQSGGDLAVMDSAEENDALFAAIGAKIDVGSMWIGLSDAGKEDDFRWASGEALGVPPWRGGEPNNLGDEDCAEWLPGDGRANDLACQEKRASLCEKPKASVAR